MSNYLIVTGGSYGIGLSIAEHFLEQQFNVINLSRTPCPLSGVTNFEVDLAESGFEKNLLDLLSLLADASKITLVHNACQLGIIDTITDVEPSVLREMLEINIVSPVILNKLIIPKMKEGSSIIYIGSTLSTRATAGALSYVTAKHAMVGLMKMTCQDLWGTGVHTACICPGFTDTPGAKLYQTIPDQDEKWKSFQTRLVQPEEVAKTVYFAATNPVINGSLLMTDLGQKEG
jgi:3-oxoacyl-[acyl-carrier protein] reductase